MARSGDALFQFRWRRTLAHAEIDAGARPRRHVFCPPHASMYFIQRNIILSQLVIYFSYANLPTGSIQWFYLIYQPILRIFECAALFYLLWNWDTVGVRPGK